MGVPWIIKIDHGPTYISQQFNDFMESLKNIHTACNSYNTQGQAIVEHANNTIKELLVWVIYPKAKQVTNFDLVEVLFHINFLNFDEAELSLAYKHWKFLSQYTPLPLVI